jgi:polysaccharide biosynthesis protein PslG
MNRLLFSLFLLTFFLGTGETMVRAEENKINPFGVLEFLHWNHSWNNFQYPDQESLEKSVALMKAAGVGFVRVDFGWQDIEPEQGKNDYSKYDALVDLLSRNKIEILGILDYCADWASPKKAWNYPNPDNAFFLNYAKGVVGRYKDKVKYWELWNEPDSQTYWNPQDGLKGYVNLLKEVYVQLKKIDPDCKILNGGLASGLLGVNRLYDNGAQGYFDIMNIHIFETPLDPQAIKRAQAFIRLTGKVMARNNDADKKIWITEIGCPGVKTGKKVQNWWMGKNPSEKDQAGWVKEVYGNLLKDKSVGIVFWAFFRDTNEHWKNGVDYFGLIRNDFSQKPAFNVYKEVCQKWNK